MSTKATAKGLPAQIFLRAHCLVAGKGLPNQLHQSTRNKQAEFLFLCSPRLLVRRHKSCVVPLPRCKLTSSVNQLLIFLNFPFLIRWVLAKAVSPLDRSEEHTVYQHVMRSSLGW